MENQPTHQPVYPSTNDLDEFRLVYDPNCSDFAVRHHPITLLLNELDRVPRLTPQAVWLINTLESADGAASGSEIEQAFREQFGRHMSPESFARDLMRSGYTRFTYCGDLENDGDALSHLAGWHVVPEGERWPGWVDWSDTPKRGFSEKSRPEGRE